jgi:hypothetical protein
MTELRDEVNATLDYIQVQARALEEHYECKISAPDTTTSDETLLLGPQQVLHDRQVPIERDPQVVTEVVLPP